MKAYQFILRGAESSCRGVRMRVLSATEVDKTTLDAAQSLDPSLEGNAARVAHGIATRNLGVRRSIVAYTKDPVKPVGKQWPTLSEDSLWTKVDPSIVAFMDANWDDIFTASDDAVLGRAYSKRHSAEAVEDILGEAIEVEMG